MPSNVADAAPKVLMAGARLGHDEVPAADGGGLWFSDDLLETDAIRSWSSLAAMLCNEWNVVGVDLQLADLNTPTLVNDGTCSFELILVDYVKSLAT